MKRKDKDAEALWAEVKRLTLEMGRLQQQYDEQTACMIVHRGRALACSDAVRAAYFDESRRAERLAEALEMCLELEERPRVIEFARAALAADALEAAQAEVDALRAEVAL